MTPNNEVRIVASLPNMPNRLTPEQIQALQSVPLGNMPNKLRVALAMVQARQSDLAEETGLFASGLSDIVNGKYGDLNIETGRKIAAFFGCAIEDLFPAREAA